MLYCLRQFLGSSLFPSWILEIWSPARVECCQSLTPVQQSIIVMVWTSFWFQIATASIIYHCIGMSNIHPIVVNFLFPVTKKKSNFIRQSRHQVSNKQATSLQQMSVLLAWRCDWRQWLVFSQGHPCSPSRTLPRDDNLVPLGLSLLRNFLL